MKNKHWFGTGAVSRGPQLVPGMILPFNDNIANAPAGTEAWNVAEDRVIKCAAEAGQTGGSNQTTQGSSTQANHTGSNRYYWVSNQGGCRFNRHHGAAGSHSHTMTITFFPARRYQPFVRITEQTDKIPLNCGFLSDLEALEGLDPFATDGYYLGVSNGNSEAVNKEKDDSAVSNSTGNHTHQEGVCREVWYNHYTHPHYTSKGNHSHNAASDTTDNIRRYAMALFYAASEGLVVPQGAYVLFDGAEIPEGWFLCDGENGTPDLTDHFIHLDRTKLGQFEGDGTITVFGTLSSSGNHNHESSNRSPDTDTGKHTTGHAHTQTFGPAAKTFEPPFYTLKILKAMEQ